MVENNGADILDINFGCSVKKILKSGSGAALMRTPKLAVQILTAIRKAVNIPLTIKIRTGWDNTGDQAIEIAGIAADCGVDAIAYHPRTASQGFRGNAQWHLITKLKQVTDIPVIGNGDIKTAADAIRMKRETGCDAVMVGRAAIGNPLIFRQILAMEEAKPVPEMTIAERIHLMTRYLEASVEYIGEKKRLLHDAQPSVLVR